MCIDCGYLSGIDEQEWSLHSPVERKGAADPHTVERPAEWVDALLEAQMAPPGRVGREGEVEQHVRELRGALVKLAAAVVWRGSGFPVVAQNQTPKIQLKESQARYLDKEVGFLVVQDVQSQGCGDTCACCDARDPAFCGRNGECAVVDAGDNGESDRMGGWSEVVDAGRCWRD